MTSRLYRDEEAIHIGYLHTACIFCALLIGIIGTATFFGGKATGEQKGVAQNVSTYLKSSDVGDVGNFKSHREATLPVSRLEEEKPASTESAVLFQNELVVCTGDERANKLAQRFAQTNTDQKTFSVAYDAFWHEDSCGFHSNVMIDTLSAFYKYDESGEFVFVFKVLSISDEEEPDEQRFAFILSPGIYSNIFRCQRDPDEVDQGYDSSLECIGNT